MNPQGAPGFGGGFARSINNDTNNNGGFTVGNLDQSQVSLKEENSKTKTIVGADRSDVTHDVPRESHVIEATNHVQDLPQSNKFVHIAQDDFNVRRSHLPDANSHKRSLAKKKHKKVKRHSRPRPPCNDDGSAIKKSTEARFDMLGDFNEIMDKAVKRKRSNRRRRSAPRGKSRDLLRSTRDTRQEGELYNIHDGVLNPVMESRSCISAGEKKKSDISSKLSNHILRKVRSEEEKGTRAKKSGVKTMKIHNELGGMHIKSDPSQTAVTSESGNIEITMLNDQGTSSIRRDEKGDVKNILPNISGMRYENGASSRTLEQKHHPKVRLYLAQDESIKKSGISVLNDGRLALVN